MTRRNIVCHAAGATIGICLTIFLVMLLDRRPVLALDPSQSYASPNPARAGEPISITWSAIARRNCAGYVIPRVIDSTGHIFEFAYTPTVYQDLLTPGASSFTKIITLPIGMAPGRARYEAVITRWCNRFQNWLWPMVDVPFPIWFDVKD